MVAHSELQKRYDKKHTFKIYQNCLKIKLCRLIVEINQDTRYLDIYHARPPSYIVETSYRELHRNRAHLQTRSDAKKLETADAPTTTNYSQPVGHLQTRKSIQPPDCLILDKYLREGDVTYGNYL